MRHVRGRGWANCHGALDQIGSPRRCGRRKETMAWVQIGRSFVFTMAQTGSKHLWWGGWGEGEEIFRVKIKHWTIQTKTSVCSVHLNCTGSITHPAHVNFAMGWSFFTWLGESHFPHSHHTVHTSLKQMKKLNKWEALLDYVKFIWQLIPMCFLPSPQTWAILTQTPLPHPIPILPPPHLPQKINIIHEKLIIIKKKGRKTNKRHAI